MEDFQSDDDYNAEEGIFNYADAGWGVRDVSWTSWGPESGQDREVVMSGQRLYNQYQTAYLKACLLYTSPSPRDGLLSRMPSSA